MSKDPSTERLQELLNTLYANIVQHVNEDMLSIAEKSFYSTRDYALGDTVSCTAEAALENCEQIKSCFANTAPGSVFSNIEEIKGEIERLERGSRPFLLGKLWLLIIIAAVAFLIYFVLTHRN
jgi:hypothetical protein